MLSAFKLKPMDLEPIFAEWKDAPRFEGKRKKDPLVSTWLDAIKAGCIERKIPQESWHKVAQHYMGDNARGRLVEVKTVMSKVHGGKFRWNWRKFSTAMLNMGWDIDRKATEPIKVEKGNTGGWWFTRKSDGHTEPLVEPTPPPRPAPVKTKSAPVLSRSKSMFRLAEPSPVARPLPPPPVRSNTMPESIAAIAEAPVWLLNACQSLSYLTVEHPRIMSTISAVLITVGTLPAMPAIAAGAGGVVLASHAAQAAGAIAVGIGSWLKAQTDDQVRTQAQEKQGTIGNA